MKPMHWLIVLIVLLVLFGASKLPDVAHAIGQSAKVLKKDLKDLQEDDGPAPAVGQGPGPGFSATQPGVYGAPVPFPQQWPTVPPSPPVRGASSPQSTVETGS